MTQHCSLEHGENEGYNFGDSFQEDNFFYKVVASSKSGPIGSNYHVRIFANDGSLLSSSMIDSSIREFIQFTRDNRENWFAITDIPKSMKPMYLTCDAISRFDLSRLKNCYYPYWW